MILADISKLEDYAFGLDDFNAENIQNGTFEWDRFINFKCIKNNDIVPTYDAIPIDDIKKAREEIEELNIYFDNDYLSSNNEPMFKCKEVLAIIDKLIEGI